MTREITENLFIANADQARRRGDEFDRVISLATPPETSTHQFLIDDGEHSYEKFSKAVDCIIDGLDSNETVLVHCQAGISRSVSATIAAYCDFYNKEYYDGFDKCRHGFMNPAPELEKSAKKYISED